MQHKIDPSRDFSIERNSNSMPFVHAHLDHELYYLKKGETCYFIEDKIFQVSEGAFVFIPKGVLHKTQYLNASGAERILLKADYEFFFNEHLNPIIETLSKRYVQYVSEEHLKMFHELFEKIENITPLKTESEKILYNLYIAELLALLCEFGVTESSSDSSTDDKFITSVQEYIGKNHEKPITLSVLSKLFSVSEEHLSRRFKQKTGICISEFINYQRISHAADLLKNRGTTVTEAAEKCGFNDSNYFSTVFKKIMGISPKKFSIQHRN